MSLSEDVLRDLLLEHGIEGVTLWHIKALAAYFHGLKVCGTRYYPVVRLDSDFRGEETVWAEAIAEDTGRWQRKTVNAFHNRDRREIEQGGACAHQRPQLHQINDAVLEVFCERCGTRVVLPPLEFASLRQMQADDTLRNLLFVNGVRGR